MKDQGGSASNVTANAGDVVGKRAGDDDRAAAEALVQRMRARRVRLRRPTMNEAPAIVPVPAATRASPGFPAV